MHLEQSRFKLRACNLCESSPSLIILVPLHCIIISFVAFNLSKLLFNLIKGYFVGVEITVTTRLLYDREWFVLKTIGKAEQTSKKGKFRQD